METLIEKLTIRQRGEQHYFQINMPRKAQRIVTVALGLFFNEPINVTYSPVTGNPWLGIQRNTLLGEVQLQAANAANFFYKGELVQEDNNIGVMDFIQPPLIEEDTGNGTPIILPIKQYWKSQQFTHGNRIVLDSVGIENEKVVYGCYQDIVGTTEQKNIHYTVLVYIGYQ
jgi:hypothetical protein